MTYDDNQWVSNNSTDFLRPVEFVRAFSCYIQLETVGQLTEKFGDFHSKYFFLKSIDRFRYKHRLWVRQSHALEIYKVHPVLSSGHAYLLIFRISEFTSAWTATSICIQYQYSHKNHSQINK
jgi:hypothetical protein